MNIRQAILKSADHIEQRPTEFDYDSVDIPESPGCGTPACAIGWIAHFLEVPSFPHPTFDGIVECDACEFYTRMDEMSGGGRPEDEDAPYIKGRWREDAAVCADTLRRYAEKYHPVAA